MTGCLRGIVLASDIDESMTGIRGGSVKRRYFGRFSSVLVSSSMRWNPGGSR